MSRRFNIITMTVLILMMFAPAALADHQGPLHWKNTNGWPIRLTLVDYSDPAAYAHGDTSWVAEMAAAYEVATNNRIRIVYTRASKWQYCDAIPVEDRFRQYTITFCEDNTNFSYTGTAVVEYNETTNHLTGVLVKMYPKPPGTWGEYVQTNLCHEMGHAMGLNHATVNWQTDEGTYSCLGVGWPQWPTEHDAQALRNKYDHRDG